MRQLIDLRFIQLVLVGDFEDQFRCLSEQFQRSGSVTGGLL
jgi:hypothetical protein